MNQTETLEELDSQGAIELMEKRYGGFIPLERANRITRPEQPLLRLPDLGMPRWQFDGRFEQLEPIAIVLGINSQFFGLRDLDHTISWWLTPNPDLPYGLSPVELRAANCNMELLRAALVHLGLNN